MFKFEKIPNKENQFDDTHVVVKCESATYPDILQAFQEFMLGCGFSPETVGLWLKEDEQHDI